MKVSSQTIIAVLALAIIFVAMLPLGAGLILLTALALALLLLLEPLCKKIVSLTWTINYSRTTNAAVANMIDTTIMQEPILVTSQTIKPTVNRIKPTVDRYKVV